MQKFCLCIFKKSNNELLKPLSDDLKTKIKAWNDIDVKIFTKANETFWERYNKIPNVEKMEQEFKYETGTLRLNNKLSGPKPKYSIFHFLRKSEEIMFDGSVRIFTRICVEICVVDKTTVHIRFNIYENPCGRGS